MSSLYIWKLVRGKVVKRERVGNISLDTSSAVANNE